MALVEDIYIWSIFLLVEKHNAYCLLKYELGVLFGSPETTQRGASIPEQRCENYLILSIATSCTGIEPKQKVGKENPCIHKMDQMALKSCGLY